MKKLKIMGSKLLPFFENRKLFDTYFLVAANKNFSREPAPRKAM